TVARGAWPGRQERVLDGVFGGFALAEDPIGQGVREAPVAVVQRGEGTQIPRGERSQEGVVGRLKLRHYEKCTVDGQGWMWGKKSVPSDLPPCPTAASKLCGLAVEPTLDILSDRR